MSTTNQTEEPGRGLRARLQAGVERGDVYAPDCPSRALLDHVTSRWGVLVLGLLLDGPHRFNQLATLVVGVSDKMLSQTLKVLVADAFVERVVNDGPPVHVSYQLTEAGRQVALRVADLVDWLETNMGVAGPERLAALAGGRSAAG